MSSSQSLSSNLLSPTQDLPMAPIDRSVGRNVYIYSTDNPTKELGGLICTAGITNANFYFMVEILIIFTKPFALQNEEGTKVEENNHPLQPGKYYIITDGLYNVNNEIYLTRAFSYGSGFRVRGFRDAVRRRDGQCIITGDQAVTLQGIPEYTEFEAAHIFPLAYEEHWRLNNYARWISEVPSTGGAINSVQNGILLNAAMHKLFDSYALSINPDDNFKVVAFRPNSRRIGGQHLDREHFARPNAPSLPLLRWHFRQAVLANMRGTGEPIFESDFPPGSDIMGEILCGPKVAERMEFELFDRLGAERELTASTD